MSLVDILDHPNIQLPIKKQSTNEYFPSYVSDILSKFENLLINFNINPNIVDPISNFREYIFQSLESYFSGDQSTAYDSFKEAMLVIDPELKNLVLELEETEFFRARVNNESVEDFSKDQMFHIPFQLRTKVTTQRYSFPGLPCLYLGASPYVCWSEMNRPSYDSFNVARIEKVSNKNIKVLDLNRTPTSIKAEYINNSNDEFIINYLKIWPLIVVCSVCVFDEVGSFKPEYIIPQMLLQWLITEDDISRMSYNVHGIRYFSVKSNSEGSTTNQLRMNYPRMYTNYVFPIKKSKRSGFCSDLQNLFNISSSISGRTLQLVIPQRGTGLFTGTKQPEENMDLEKIVLHDGRTTLYSQSAFYWFEKVLREPSQITLMDGDVFLQYT